MLLAAFASFFGLHLYIRAAAPLGRASSPFSLAAITYPSSWIVLDLAIVLKCVGVALAYLILIGELMSNFMKGCLMQEPTDVVPSSVWVDPRVWIALFMLIILPLSFLRRMDHLRYSSFLGLASILYLTTLSLVMLLIAPPATTVTVMPFPPKFGINLLSSFGIFIFAFTCHQNVSSHTPIVPLLFLMSRSLFSYNFALDFPTD
jgi:amino acid permease